MTKKKSILLVSHYTPTQGMADKFFDFLKEKYSVALLVHPLYPSSPLTSVYRSSLNKIKKKIKIPSALQYVAEMTINYQFTNQEKKFDLIICFDPLSFFNIYFYKFLVNRDAVLVYYNLDYSKERFPNALMNNIYQYVHRFAFRKSNFFMSPTAQVIADFDPMGKYKEKCFVLKHSVNVKSIHKKKRIPNSIVYAGTLGLTVDFHPLFLAIKKMEKEHISYHFDIYGDGVHKEKIMDDAKSLGLKNIVFHKPVENEKLVTDILPQYMISVAPYITEKRKGVPDHIFHGTDITSKIVEYMAAGLPVISTRLYKAFEQIEKEGYGILAGSTDKWFSAITTLLHNKKIYQQYKKNAENAVKAYDVEETVTPLLEKFLQ